MNAYKKSKLMKNTYKEIITQSTFKCMAYKVLFDSKS